ncbi:MAG: SsrA-binding protein SmpB [Clostridia bacterium]|nr:SsrA-binding protein SmpB [Clostridia bacterium]
MEQKLIADNKKAYFDYFIEDKFQAGLVLEGVEIKSVRAGKVNLKDSYVMIKNGEVFLMGAHIAEYEKADGLNKVDTRRTRKLLLTKSEIRKLERKVNIKGYTVVPTKMYLSHNLAKLEIAVAKGKELYNKKDSLKEKDIKRETDRMLKGYK